MSVFHLKYRPEKFDELDLPEVSEKIRKIAESKEVFQAILLAGPKGSGKTSSARILAKAVNCLSPKNGEACGECENCKEIERGNSLDIIEIDAASNRGIDDVRSLKENAYLAPIKLQKKIFIIDEVHMLTKEAFNALLKLIEEPPRNTFFIMCTTDAHRIPETVLSRLLKINFRKGNQDELLGSLEKVVKGEKVKISEKAKKKIVSNSDGSFRNLQKNFNEIYLQFGETIKDEDVDSFFAQNRGEYEADDFEKDLREGRQKEIIEKLEDMAKKGVDFGEIRMKWLEEFHQKMLIDLTDEFIKKIIEALIRAGELEKSAGIEQLPLELMVVEMGGGQETRFVGGQTRNENQEEKIDREIDKVAEEVEDKKEANVEMPEIELKWPEVLSAVKPFNHSVEAFLRAARPKKIDKDGLLIEVFYKFHKDKLEEQKNRKIVEIGLDKVFGGLVKFRCVLAEKKPEAKNETRDTRNERQDVEDGKGGEIDKVAEEIFG